MQNEQARQSLKREMDQFLAAEERRAFNMALMATGNRDDALEIVQEAMYKLVQKYAKKDPAHWGPLFTRILQNRIKNWYRRQSLVSRWFSSNEADSDSVQEQTFPAENDFAEQLSQSSPVSAAQQQGFMQALELALRALPFRQQQVFLLRAVQGLDVAETANAMACSQGSVKTHYSRALQKLKQQLAEYS